MAWDRCDMCHMPTQCRRRAASVCASGGDQPPPGLQPLACGEPARSSAFPTHHSIALSAMSLIVVETQTANYLFACPSAAEKFAASERQWWIDHCPGIGTVPIRPVPLGPEHKFQAPNSPSTGAFSSNPIPLDALPSQLKCRRVQRRIMKWQSARDDWQDAVFPSLPCSHGSNATV